MKTSAIEGAFEIELEIKGHGTATARATHRLSKRVYDFEITPPYLVRHTFDNPVENPEFLAAREAVMSVARANGMIVTADPASFGFAEAGDRAGFGQAPFGDKSFTDTAPPFAFDTQGQGLDEGTWDPAGAAATSPPRLPLVEDLAFPQRNYAYLALLATSLEKLAREEIKRIDGDRPNEPTIIGENKRRRDLLTILANGFAKIAVALSDAAENPDQSFLLGKAKAVVGALNDQIREWCQSNAADAIDWAIRIPVLASGVALLGLAGASMSYATLIVGAMVGGDKVAKVAQRLIKPD